MYASIFTITKVQMSLVSILIILICVCVSDLTVLIYCQAASIWCLQWCTSILLYYYNAMFYKYHSGVLRVIGLGLRRSHGSATSQKCLTAAHACIASSGRRASNQAMAASLTSPIEEKRRREFWRHPMGWLSTGAARGEAPTLMT